MLTDFAPSDEGLDPPRQLRLDLSPHLLGNEELEPLVSEPLTPADPEQLSDQDTRVDDEPHHPR
jgi:hypothetical protein